MNGVSGPDGEDYSPWADRKAAQPKASSPPQSQSKLSDSYSNTLPVRKSVAPKNSYAASKGSDASRVVLHPRGGRGASSPPCTSAPVQHPGARFTTPPRTLRASPGSPSCLWASCGAVTIGGLEPGRRRPSPRRQHAGDVHGVAAVDSGTPHRLPPPRSLGSASPSCGRHPTPSPSP